MIETALTDLWYGFGVALQPHNLMWCFIGVLVGNMVGVLPGMGPLATISILLPLTFGIKPVGAILMLAGVMYGAQYGGAICSILLNLPCHPPHAVTCLDGFPMTKQGRGGVALGLTVMASFVGASWGITEMIFLSPILVRVALQFGPAEICSLMLLGLLAGSTLARGSPLKGVAMTVLGLMLGIVGTDLETGAERFTFGMTHLDDGIELVALALGLFGIAEFMNSINQVLSINAEIHECSLARHAPQQSGPEAGDRADVPRDVGRQPVRADSGHGTDHCIVRRLCDRKENLEAPRKVRHRLDRRRDRAGSIDAFVSAGRFHSDHEPRHSGRRRDGAVARRADDPGHRARSAADQGASGYLLGPRGQLLDRQHHARSAERAVDRDLGEAADDPVQVPLSKRTVLCLHRRLRRQQ